MDASLRLQGALWLTAGGENFGGHGRVALLESIAACGSITRAARALGMSYKAAWDAVDSMNRLAGEPLVERLVGGRGGGGTRLTARGERLVTNFRLLEREHRRFLERLGRQAAGIADDWLLLGRIGLQASARNQLAARVTGLLRGDLDDRVELALAGGTRLLARVTPGSVEALGLAPGSEVVALIKASALLLAGPGQVPGPDCSRLCGVVGELRLGQAGGELTVVLAGGPRLLARVGADHGLRPGDEVCLLVEAADVMLGTPA